MSSITSVNSKIYTYDQKDREVLPANIVQAVEAAPEVSIQSLVDELAAAKIQFQALNNKGRDQPIADKMSELFIKVQTGIDLAQKLDAAIQKNQSTTDRGKNIIKRLIMTRSEANILNVDEIDMSFESSNQIGQADVILNQQALIKIVIDRQQIIADIDAQIQDHEEQIAQGQSSEIEAMQARAESLAASHSALQAIKKNLDQLTQG